MRGLRTSENVSGALRLLEKHSLTAGQSAAPPRADPVIARSGGGAGRCCAPPRRVGDSISTYGIIWVSMQRQVLVAILAILTCSHSSAQADVNLPAIFGDHMVLQRGAKVPVWGKADAGERVTVKVAAQEKSTTAGEDGNWRIVLDAVESSESVEMTVAGKNTITFKDVLFGEVWVCSGQSNMGFALKGATGGAEAIKSADRPQMRLFMVGRAIEETPQEDLSKGKWEVCSPETVGGFSAVAYFFGRDLQDTLKCPVGLIQPSWGGTRAEAWMPRPTFARLLNSLRRPL